MTGLAAPKPSEILDEPRYLKGEVTDLVRAGSNFADLKSSNDGSTNQSRMMLFTHRKAEKFVANAKPSASEPIWVSFPLREAYIIRQYALVSADSDPSADPKSWALYGSSDGTGWNILDSRSGVTFSGRGQQIVFDLADNTSSYKYYKFEITENNGNAGKTQLACLQLGTGRDIYLNYADRIDAPNTATDDGTSWNRAGGWGKTATREEKLATFEAFNIEFNRQRDLYNYNLGRRWYNADTLRVGNDNMVLSEIENPPDLNGSNINLTDNLGNAGGDTRKWAAMASPYPGIAFSIKGYFCMQRSTGGTNDDFNPTANTALAPLGNQFCWTDPVTGKARLYQVFQERVRLMDPDGQNRVLWGRDAQNKTAIVGGGATASVKQAMQYAYAVSAWNLMTPGHMNETGVKTENGIIFQEFFGNDSTGASPEAGRGLDKNYGITYIVAKNDTADTAYLITGDMFTAWATNTWENPTSASPVRFAASGAPTGNQFIDADGNTRQNFENFSLIIDKDTGEVTTAVDDSTIQNFVMPNAINQVVKDDHLTFLIKSGVDITKLAPTFEISGSCTVNPASGSVQDFTSPVQYTVTSPSVGTRVYTVTAISEDSISQEDKDKVELIKARIDLLPDTVTKSDSRMINLIEDEWNSLSEIAKMLIPEASASKLSDAVTQLNETPFRITCVGSSTTEGAGSTDSSKYSYPAQLQTLLGDRYKVTNAGLGGTTVVSGAGTYQYLGTAKYNEGMASKPDMVLMFVGSNDATNNNWDRTDVDYPALFKKCYKDLLEGYKNLDTKPTVVVCYPYCAFTGDGRPTIVPDKVLPILDEIAAEYGCPILDLYTPTSFGQNWKSLMPDGLHPNDEGYAIVAKAAAEFISEYHSTELTGLKAGNQEIELIPGLYDYGVVVSGSGIPSLSAATAANQDADVQIVQATGSLPATAGVTVTTKDGTRADTYTVTFARSEAEIASQLVAKKIASIGSVTLAKKETIVSTRSAYNALTTVQKGKILNLALLNSAEAALAAIEADMAEAQKVIDQIAAIGNYTSPSQTDTVKAARTAYNALTASQKALVSNFGDLAAAEAKIPEIDPVAYATDLINAVGDTPTYRQGKEIRAARAFYDTLDSQTKEKITNYSKLTGAETIVKASYDVFHVTVSASTWSSRYSKTPWMNEANVTSAEREATAAAMADELRYEYVMEGYAMGKTSGTYNIDNSWGSNVLIQTDNNIYNADGTGLRYETDNVGNPWNQNGRYWSMVTAPFTGMAFSQKGYFGLTDYAQAALGNSFSYQGKMYQVYWDAVRSHEDVPLAKDTSVPVTASVLFPGSDEDGNDATNNTFRYAYASYSQAHKWEGKTLGIPSGVTSEVDGSVIYQPYEGPDGKAYIAGSGAVLSAANAQGGKPEGAYVVVGTAASAFEKLGADDAARFHKTGAPLSDAEQSGDSLVQTFEKGVLTVNSDGSYVFRGDVIPGDVDGNEEVNAADVVALRRLIASGDEPTAEQLTAGDLNEDGLLTSADVTALLDQLDILPGDVDNNKQLAALDIMVMRKLMLSGGATDTHLAAGDLDGNGELGALDIMKLRKLMLES